MDQASAELRSTSKYITQSNLRASDAAGRTITSSPLGESVYFQIDIKHAIDTSQNDFHFYITADDFDNIWSEEIDTLGAGESRTIDFVHEFDKPGTYRIDTYIMYQTSTSHHPDDPEFKEWVKGYSDQQSSPLSINFLAFVPGVVERATQPTTQTTMQPYIPSMYAGKYSGPPSWSPPASADISRINQGCSSAGNPPESRLSGTPSWGVRTGDVLTFEHVNGDTYGNLNVKTIHWVIMGFSSDNKSLLVLEIKKSQNQSTSYHCEWKTVDGLGINKLRVYSGDTETFLEIHPLKVNGVSVFEKRIDEILLQGWNGYTHPTKDTASLKSWKALSKIENLGSYGGKSLGFVEIKTNLEAMKKSGILNFVQDTHYYNGDEASASWSRLITTSSVNVPTISSSQATLSPEPTPSPQPIPPQPSPSPQPTRGTTEFIRIGNDCTTKFLSEHDYADSINQNKIWVNFVLEDTAGDLLNMCSGQFYVDNSESNFYYHEIQAKDITSANSFLESMKNVAQNHPEISIDKIFDLQNAYLKEGDSFVSVLLQKSDYFLELWETGKSPSNKLTSAQIIQLAILAESRIPSEEDPTGTSQSEDGILTTTDNSQIKIPKWIKNNAEWWVKGTIDDSSFLSGIEYMIKEEVIRVPISASSEKTGDGSIPSWIKQNADWWAKDLVSDEEFANAIGYLVEQGIIKVG